MRKIYYTLEKNQDKWVIWKNVESERTFSCFNQFSGKKNNCKTYCRENNIKLRHKS